jgi:hypothetical protein
MHHYRQARTKLQILVQQNSEIFHFWIVPFLVKTGYYLNGDDTFTATFATVAAADEGGKA